MRDWTPIKKGTTYCSPSCGCGCKHKDFLRAQKESKILAKKLGYVADVWENCGWNYHVVSSCGRITVSPSIHRGKILGYNCYIGECGGGRWTASAKTPELAIKKARQALSDDLKQFADLI